MPVNIRVPRRTLLVLCGSAGSGKSTFAAQHFGATPTTSVSSDQCRALICDDPNNQQANLDTFDLFYYIINKRLLNGRFTVADSTALRPDARRRLWELARRHGYLACLLVFNIPPELCLERDQQRTRQVGPQVIAYHAGLFQQALLTIPNEGWDAVHILTGNDIDIAIEVED
ncbi:MAG: AAA family ATPase [Chloroflexota bacterium]|nr:AAA family ATPase [Chloroflexota bacterium]